MKGNKKLLIVAALLLLTAVSYSTYAIYKSSATGSQSVNAANWVVEVGNATTTSSIVGTNTFTLESITWDNTNRIGQAGTIAPGDHGTVTIKIDADGSQVDVDYTITIDTTALNNPNFTVNAHSGSQLSDTIAYSATAGEMEATVTLDIVWNGVDSSSANSADIALAGTQISIPVTVTAVQHPNPAA